VSDLGSTSERPGTAAALRRQNDALRQAIAVVDRLTTIALEGVDVEGITAELTNAIHGDVAVFDQLLRPLAASASSWDGGEVAERPIGTWSIADKRFAGVLETARDRRLPLRIRAVPEWGLNGDVVIAPIAVGEQVLGYLVVTTRATDGGEEDLELLTVQHAASIYALALVEAQRDAALRGRYRAELAETLLLGTFDPASAGEIARLAGIRLGVGQVLLAIAPAAGVGGARSSPEASDGISLLESLAFDLDSIEEGVVAFARLDHVIVIAPVVLASGDDSASRVTDLVRRRFPSVEFAFGASVEVHEPAEFSRGETQARRALAIAQRLGAVGEITKHESLGVHRLLLHVPEEDLRSFAEDVLGELTAYDVAQRASLLETLAAFLGANGNLRRAGDELFVHVNTVSYRIRRIEEITALDLNSSGDRLLAHMAIEALRSVSDRGPGTGDVYPL
jgi:PucR C-terminal helix-turn-helix domain/GGDEF-like domain